MARAHKSPLRFDPSKVRQVAPTRCDSTRRPTPSADLVAFDVLPIALDLLFG